MLSMETLRRVARFMLFSPLSVRMQAHGLGLLSKTAGRASRAVKDCDDRIVVIKLDRIGDFVLLTPFIRELRRNCPRAWISLVVSEPVLPLALPCPYVNAVIGCPRPAPGLRGILRHWAAWLRLSWMDFLPLRPTLAVMPRWDVDLYEAYALLAFTCAERRISFSEKGSPEKEARNRGADALLTAAVTCDRCRHEVEKNLDLLRALRMAVRDELEELWPQADPMLLQRQFLPDRSGHRLLALCPFSAEELKNWQLENFLEIARRFETRPGITLVLMAGPEYAFVTDLPAVRVQGNLVSLAGRLTLDETAALLTRCELVLAVDTGLMHMAGALHRPMVVVSAWPKDADPGSHYSPVRFGPWKADITMISPPAGAPGPRPIDRIGVDEVFAALNARMRVT